METFKIPVDLRCGFDCFYEIIVLSIKKDEELVLPGLG